MTVTTEPTAAPAATPSKTWEEVSAAKIAAREALVPAEWRLPEGTSLPLNVLDVPRTSGILTAKELEITETPAVKLVAQLAARELSAVDVTTAFSKRAAVAHQVTNCLTEILFEDALAQARELDAEIAQTGVPRGPLHGLPISLKDNVNVPGYDSTVGFINHAFHPAGAEDEADIVTTMRAAGAVFFCKTNVPTGMLMGETYNNVWGYTPNPYNTEYGSGGSSGGEAALLAMRGSPLGVGTDIGGSIRMPAAICGIYGIKAAGGRYPSMGVKAGLPGQEAIKSVCGPMSADLSALELWSKVMIGSKPWERDPNVYPVPWKEIELPEKLSFGIIYDDGVVKPTPPVRRALLETKAALEAAGHNVVEWETRPPGKQGNDLLMRFLLGDGGLKLRAAVTGAPIPEPWPKGLEMVEHVYNMHKDKPPTVSGLWDLQLERQAYLRKLLASWAATKDVSGTGRPFDGIISPATAFPSNPRYEFKHAGYTAIWNLADQTGCAFPVTRASKDDTSTDEDKAREYYGDDDKAVWEAYSAERVDGMPVGLQVIVPRHNEELALKLTGVIAAALDKNRQ